MARRTEMKMVDVERRFGRRVVAYRATAKLTQERLAEKIDVVPVTISRLERGATPRSRLSNALLALGVEIKDLFDGDIRAGFVS
jgi:transcriptional regulator with XRE-family HTH domain